MVGWGMGEVAGRDINIRAPYLLSTKHGWRTGWRYMDATELLAVQTWLFLLWRGCLEVQHKQTEHKLTFTS